jgi:hypothetical protein
MVNMATVIDLGEELYKLKAANGIQDKEIQLAVIYLGFRSD